MTLEDLYTRACQTPTDINEHLPYLRHLAEQCSHVTEFGTRAGNSTTALLSGFPDTLICYDLVRYTQVDELSRLSLNGTVFEFNQADVLQTEIEETDLLFVDTWHVYEQLRAELKLHAGKVRDLIVLHDTESYGSKGETPGHRGIWPAIQEFLKRGTFSIVNHFANCNGLTVLKRIAPESKAIESATQPAIVYVGTPWYGGFPGQVLDKRELDAALDPHGGDRASFFLEGSAFHCQAFNKLWISCLNTRFLGWTHFAMIHQDVRPDGYWLSTMLAEMRRTGADVLSVVLPIKTDHGLTSTAILEESTGRLLRLTKKQIAAIPADTFNAIQAGFPGWRLLVSSGLWIADLSKPWVEKVWFESRHRIIRDPSGLFREETVSEDWAFSMALHDMGLKVLATKIVPCGHWGQKEYRNDDADGIESDVESPGKFGGWASWPQPGQ